MKKIIICCFVAMFLAGCSGVMVNSEYDQLIDKTAALSITTSDLAQADKLTADEMKTALKSQSETWQKIKNAKDGVK